MLPFTRKILMDWAGPAVFQQGKTLFDKKMVLDASFEYPMAHGLIRYGQSALTCRFKILPNGSSENRCLCYDSQRRWITCAHVVALGLELLKKQAEQEWVLTRTLVSNQSEGRAYLRRESPGTPHSIQARLYLRLPYNWVEHWRQTDRVLMECWVYYAGTMQRIHEAPTDLPFAFNPRDEAVLFVWEDIAGGPAPGQIELGVSDFNNLLDLYVGRYFLYGSSNCLSPVKKDKVETSVAVSLDWETGELCLTMRGHLAGNNGDLAPTSADDVYLISEKTGWLWHDGTFRLLATVLPLPLHALYQGTVRIARESVPRCLNEELSLIKRHVTVSFDFDPALLDIQPGVPRYRLMVCGSRASLSATLYAVYGDNVLAACKPDPAGYFALPRTDNILGYTVRNLSDEQRALAYLMEYNLKGETGDALSPLTGLREVRNFLGGVVPSLRRLGWQVELKGSLADFMETTSFAMPVVHIHEPGSVDWFEVNLVYEDKDGNFLPPSDIQRALLKGDASLEYRGQTILLDIGAIETVNKVFQDCSSRDGSKPGSFRLMGIYTAYVQAALTAIDGIDIEAPDNWLDRADVQNRLKPPPPLKLSSDTESILRPYQKEGLTWLRFLEQSLFHGILADDMGLGKTLQALTWLDMQRLHPRLQGKPCLVICPTSLVENWASEAQRFTPSLKVLVLQSAERHEYWQELNDYDLIITSYALLRRDIERYLTLEFAAIVLDEAQHIKNRATQNAIAAKQLRGMHRLVLTGTPIENSIADLWSIMDFLMPGYLGAYEAFRRNYEIPVSQPGPEAEHTWYRLRRKLHPFILRRLKEDVAADLPPKIERTVMCSLTEDQRKVYNQFLESSRRHLSALVAEQGFQRVRMEVLKTLLRLRQVCCHLDLIKSLKHQAAEPSGKMELCMDLLNEAISGGHKVLLFSQFTSMLAILRRRLAEEQIVCSYLDGSTKDRLRLVNEFNARRDIPVFLMSLKAGGVGLNLTGADTVIHFDPWWNPAAESQATDRAHRIGQKRSVYAVKIITRATVEEKVLAMQQRKQAVIDAALESNSDFARKLNWEDVQELLEPT